MATGRLLKSLQTRQFKLKVLDIAKGLDQVLQTTTEKYRLPVSPSSAWAEEM